ncbi:LysR family transcriptional regulator [Paenibacillus sp. DMB5]|uniref:LysR family transcriptional regulator n=1 Tax=Paenibacillus sp. DMB5 TaxID=1780103 RepID=UPI00076DBC61|nr:LysR family transcriptional regulator [Paenibacillus sp. DMB5]KUP22558.1 LysR family transcriptional regulator [Paenibacillus sp. DMB5]
MLEIRVLSYFLAVAREQNITRAAEFLHITQPALSRQMMDLEQQLGKLLFIRGRKKITLTEDGEYLRKCAQEIVELSEKAESNFLDHTTPISGDIYLACGESQAMEYIAAICRNIQLEHPNVHFRFHSGDADTIFERLEKGLADVGMLHDPIRYEKFDYVKLPTTGDRLGILMPKDSHFANSEYITSEIFSDLPIILPDQAFYGNPNPEWIGGNRSNLNIVATYNLLYNATFLVEQGVGFVVCLEGLADTSGNRNLIFRPLYPELRADMYMVTKKYKTFSSSVKMFIKKVITL